MKKSQIQFTKPDVTRFSIVENPRFDSDSDDGTFDSLELSHFVRRNPFHDDMAVVEIKLTNQDSFNRADKDYPNVRFRIIAKARASFRWEKQLPDDLVKNLLNQNAVALLLGELRPLISHVTRAGKNGAFDLPFIDLTNEDE